CWEHLLTDCDWNIPVLLQSFLFSLLLCFCGLLFQYFFNQRDIGRDRGKVLRNFLYRWTTTAALCALTQSTQSFLQPRKCMVKCDLLIVVVRFGTNHVTRRVQRQLGGDQPGCTSVRFTGIGFDLQTLCLFGKCRELVKLFSHVCTEVIRKICVASQLIDV